MQLRVCEHCERHVRVGESLCPFCDAELSAQPLDPIRKVPGHWSRAQRFAAAMSVAAAPLAGCMETSTDTTANTGGITDPTTGGTTGSGGVQATGGIQATGGAQETGGIIAVPVYGLPVTGGFIGVPPYGIPPDPTGGSNSIDAGAADADVPDADVPDADTPDSGQDAGT